MQNGPARIGVRLRSMVELVCEVGYEVLPDRGIGLRQSRGWHRVRAQFPHDLFPNVRIVRSPGIVETFEDQSTGLEPLAMASDAVLTDHSRRGRSLENPQEPENSRNDNESQLSPNLTDYPLRLLTALQASLFFKPHSVFL